MSNGKKIKKIEEIIGTKAILIEKIDETNLRVTGLNWENNEDECMGFITKIVPGSLINALRHDFNALRDAKKNVNNIKVTPEDIKDPTKDIKKHDSDILAPLKRGASNR